MDAIYMINELYATWFFNGPKAMLVDESTYIESTVMCQWFQIQTKVDLQSNSKVLHSLNRSLDIYLFWI